MNYTIKGVVDNLVKERDKMDNEIQAHLNEITELKEKRLQIIKTIDKIKQVE